MAGKKFLRGEQLMVKILLDTANIQKIESIAEYYDIKGVTTNPSILAKENVDLKKVLADLKYFAYNRYEIHIQTTEEICDDIVDEAKELREYFGETFYIKIPVTKEGLQAMKICSNIGINVTATAVLSATQALAAANQGASYVAPYVNRLENIGADVEEVINDIKTLLADYHTDILAASFKNVNQFKNVILAGAEAVTVAPEVLDASLWHPYTDKSVEDFDKDWANKFGDKKIIDFLE